ncbi:MAG: acyl-CoA dehydratase activase [Archaeoglobaceae archaeon]|nr:acyl-CoA dehydratase activase [Archaeoglobaceae archaeon]MCX8151713.1 acyl-CoA dehydratase activase [Archaeoglobaceae archaeon]MDW8013842.1 acyl-CoA dehydratase activase [Archaeoglobaceae archaeon]
MIVAGIDVGSLTAKCVLFEEKVIAYSIAKVTPDLENTAKAVYSDAVKKAGVSAEYIVATGYGRNKVSFANLKVTEITCHAFGAKSIFPSCRTVIDIGGQDSKVIAVENGVKNFVMNDKCAAGTGRFLEVMASALNVDVSKLGELDEKADKPVNISSTCTVFAESEVVSYIAQGEKVENIVAGLHNAIASRIAAMAKRIDLKPDVVLTGGVAKNKGVKRALEEILQIKILVPEEPQIVGAIGAAIVGKNYASRGRKSERF